MSAHPKSGGQDPLNHDDGPSTSRTEDDEIEEEIASISEQISFDDSHNDPSSNEVLQIGAQVAAKKRQLFAFSDDEDEDGEGVPIFKIDDSLLDGRRIADHFRDKVESDVEDEPAEIDSLEELVNSKAISNVSNRENEPPANVDNSNASAANIDSKAGNSIANRHSNTQKEISPFHDDVILLNNDKISLTSLKNSQLSLPPLKIPPLKVANIVVSPQPDETPSSATTTNQNTTNDISEIGRDDADDLSLSYLADPTLKLRVPNSKSLDGDKGQETDVGVHARSLQSSFKFNDEMFSTKPLERSDGEESSDSSYEANKSIEELVISNASISVQNTESELPTHDETVNIGMDTHDTLVEHVNMVDDSLELVSDSISDLKERILAAVTDEPLDDAEDVLHSETAEGTDIEIKKMIKVDMSKEALDDISETTEPSNDVTLHVEKNIEPTQMLIHLDSQNVPIDATENSFDSVISLNMILVYEERIKELEQLVATKDVCMEALNLQLSRRESLKEGVCESCSMVTSSTEYRTYQDECFPNKHDLNQEIIERENLIEQLTDSLQQSLLIRDQLQAQSDRLSSEVDLLRKQLADTTEVVRRPLWLRGDPDLVGGGQRISEISIDLVSESDADDMEDKARTEINAKTVEVSVESKTYDKKIEAEHIFESFQHNLTPEELILFGIVKSKFEEYLQLQLGVARLQSDNELKIQRDNLLTEKQDKEIEVS